MLDPDLITRIRNIFLHPRPHVTVAAATALLGWSRAEMNAAVEGGEIVVIATDVDRWIWREELMAKAFGLWPAAIIEEALGSDAAAVLPAALRTAELRARLPRYQLAMLEYLAEREGTTVSDVLVRELEDVASGRAEELSAAIPGFGAALDGSTVSRRNCRANDAAAAAGPYNERVTDLGPLAPMIEAGRTLRRLIGGRGRGQIAISLLRTLRRMHTNS
jgi:hypothetical protein